MKYPYLLLLIAALWLSWVQSHQPKDNESLHMALQYKFQEELSRTLGNYLEFHSIWSSEIDPHNIQVHSSYSQDIDGAIVTRAAQVQLTYDLENSTWKVARIQADGQSIEFIEALQIQLNRDQGIN